jgi:D-glycero-alpha-D-manno-heptose-7-phosphate kinase
VDEDAVPLEIINAAAPIRICDNGGWTDTWFAGHGKVFNIAVSPYVEVQIKAYRRRAQAHQVIVNAENYKERYAVAAEAPPGRHPLLEAIIGEMVIPDDMSLEISISSLAPAGSSTGTSAALAVALIGALDVLTPGRLPLHEIAITAHRVEVERLGIQSGVQDQYCAAFGGINYIEIDSYPHASIRQLQLPADTWAQLDHRLVLVYLGRAHVSSEAHDQVITALTAHRGTIEHSLEALRQAAADARDAVTGADLVALGRAMTANTEAQRRLHPDLITKSAQEVIDVAMACGAFGWKVNGAGGEGGSVTILCGEGTEYKRRLVAALPRADPLFRVLPTSLSRDGLRVWRT